MSSPDPTLRFSDRVENYAKFRPSYPEAVYAYLRAEAGLAAGTSVADLGSGTGLFSSLLLAHGHRVFAVEPNAPMRAEAERAFRGQPNFVSVDGRAEATTLADASVSFVIAAQAFHWFEPAATRGEMARILQPSGAAAFIWNKRDVEGSPFQLEYENLLLQFGTDFKSVDHQRSSADDKLAEFFAPNLMKKASFANEQLFDWGGLRGRLLSSSYAPHPDQPEFAPMLAALKALFRKHEEDGHIRFLYRTVVYDAQIN